MNDQNGTKEVNLSKVGKTRFMNLINISLSRNWKLVGLLVTTGRHLDMESIFLFIWKWEFNPLNFWKKGVNFVFV